MVSHKTKDRKECKICKGISLVAQFGKILLKTPLAASVSTASAWGSCRENKWFPTELFYIRFDVRDSSPTGVGAEEKNPFYICFIHLTKACDSVYGTLP